MSVTAKTLFEAVQAANVQTTVYAAPAGIRTIIDKFTGTNTTGIAATLTVNLVVSGGAAAVANIITQAKTIQPGEAYTFPEIVGHVLNAADFISVIAGTAAAITIRASGREVA